MPGALYVITVALKPNDLWCTSRYLTETTYYILYICSRSINYFFILGPYLQAKRIMCASFIGQSIGNVDNGF